MHPTASIYCEVGPGQGILTIPGRLPTAYAVSEFALNGGGGRGFRFSKITHGTDKTAASYDVFIADDATADAGHGSDSCDCKGFERHGHCKHHAAARDIADRHLPAGVELEEREIRPEPRPVAEAPIVESPVERVWCCHYRTCGGIGVPGRDGVCLPCLAKREAKAAPKPVPVVQAIRQQPKPVRMCIQCGSRPNDGFGVRCEDCEGRM